MEDQDVDMSLPLARAVLLREAWRLRARAPGCHLLGSRDLHVDEGVPDDDLGRGLEWCTPPERLLLLEVLARRGNAIIAIGWHDWAHYEGEDMNAKGTRPRPNIGQHRRLGS